MRGFLRARARPAKRQKVWLAFSGNVELDATGNCQWVELINYSSWEWSLAASEKITLLGVVWQHAIFSAANTDRLGFALVHDHGPGSTTYNPFDILFQEVHDILALGMVCTIDAGTKPCLVATEPPGGMHHAKSRRILTEESSLRLYIEGHNVALRGTYYVGGRVLLMKF